MMRDSTENRKNQRIVQRAAAQLLFSTIMKNIEELGI